MELAQIEMAAEAEFEAVIVNDDLERAADALVALLFVQAEPGEQASP